MFTPHPDLILPEAYGRLWRYMDFSKFVAILETSSLFFANIQDFGDPFEGTLPATTYETAVTQFKDPSWMGDGVSPKVLAMIEYAKKHHALGRNTSYASCWHLNEFESAAMWRLYLQAAEGIAIRSTVDRFCRCFVGEESVEIGRVYYEDFQKLRAPLFGNVLSPSFIKRKSFEHEHEVRALYWHNSDFCAGLSPIESASIPPKRSGVQSEVKLEILVESVFVSPTCPPWFGDIVRAVLNKYGLASIPVVRSDLASRPIL